MFARKNETPEPDVQVTHLPPPRDCCHDHKPTVETRYPTFEQMRELAVLAGSAYALKALIDVGQVIALKAVEAKTG